MKISRILSLLFVLQFFHFGEVYAQGNPRELLQKIERAKTEKDKMEIYDKLANFYTNIPDSSNKYASLGLQFSKKLNDDYSLKKLYYKTGVSLIGLGKFQDATTYLDSSKIFAQKTKDILLLGNVARAKGLGLFYQRKFDLAVEELLNAVTYYTKVNKLTSVPACFSVVGLVHSALGQNKRAIDYQKKALEMLEGLMADSLKNYSKAELLQFQKSYIDFNGNLGDYYSEVGNFKLAIQYYNKALSRGGEGINMSTHVKLLANASGAYYRLGKMAKADSLVRRSFDLAKKNRMKMQTGNALNYMAYFSQHKEISDKYYKEAAQIAKSTGQLDLLRQIYRDWSSKSEEFHDYILALEKFKAYIKLKDSLITVAQIAKIADLESTFKLKEADIKLKKAELAAESSQNQNRWLAPIVAVTMVLSLMTTLFYLRTERLNRALEKKSALLANLNAFKARSFSIIGHDVSGALSSMAAILYILKREGPDVDDYDTLIDVLTSLKDSSTEMLNGLFIWGMAELDTPKKELMRLPNDLKSSIHTASNLAAAKDVRLVVKYQTSHLVYANKEHLEFIIRNLLTNAIKFSDVKGEVKLETKREEYEVVIEVSNGGIAFDTALTSVVFSEKVSSSEGILAERGKGTGLLLCMKIAEIEGFKLELAEANNGLTKFILRIPYTQYED